MHDPRIDKLAKQLVNYSTSVKRGDNVLIDAYDVPDSIIIALIRAIRKAGGKMMRFDDARTLAKTRKIIDHRVMKPIDLGGSRTFDLSSE